MATEYTFCGRPTQVMKVGLRRILGFCIAGLRIENGDSGGAPWKKVETQKETRKSSNHLFSGAFVVSFKGR